MIAYNAASFSTFFFIKLVWPSIICLPLTYSKLAIAIQIGEWSNLHFLHVYIAGGKFRFSNNFLSINLNRKNSYRYFTLHFTHLLSLTKRVLCFNLLISLKTSLVFFFFHFVKFIFRLAYFSTISFLLGDSILWWRTHFTRNFYMPHFFFSFSLLSKKL